MAEHVVGIRIAGKARAVGQTITEAGEIVPPKIVDEAVAVVVDAVPVAGVDPAVLVQIFPRMNPDVGRDVGVVVVEARIDDGDDLARTSGRLPGLPRLDAVEAPEIGVGLTPAAAGGQERVVRLEIEGVDVVGLGEGDMVIGVELGEGRGEVGVGREIDGVDVGQTGREPFGLGGAQGGRRRRPLRSEPSDEAIDETAALPLESYPIRSPEDGSDGFGTMARGPAVEGIRAIRRRRGHGPMVREDTFCTAFDRMRTFGPVLDQDAMPGGFGDRNGRENEKLSQEEPNEGEFSSPRRRFPPGMGR